jgi:hypothetical protein
MVEIFFKINIISGRKGSASELGIWSRGGTGNRIFGDEISNVATGTGNSKVKPPKVKSPKKEKDFRKKRGRRSGEEDKESSDPVVTLVPTLQTLSL